MKPKSLLILILIFSMISCVGPKFLVNVDSICSPEPEAKKNYVLLPGLEGINANDLQYQEYANYVDKALAKKGFLKSDDIKNADIAIFLVYGIGDPQVQQYTYSLPVWGQTGVSSSSTYGTINTFDNTTTYSGTTTYTPTYGIVGSTTHTGTTVTYFRYLVLDAIDLEIYRKNKKVVQVWKTSVTSPGSSGDLRQVFPILVGASMDYIGTNTGKKVRVTLYENDKRVKEVKGLAE